MEEREMNLNTYTITAKHDDNIVHQVAAFTRKSAWGKFCYQYFGALKPSRADYIIK